MNIKIAVCSFGMGVTTSSDSSWVVVAGLSVVKSKGVCSLVMVLERRGMVLPGPVTYGKSGIRRRLGIQISISGTTKSHFYESPVIWKGANEIRVNGRLVAPT